MTPDVMNALMVLIGAVVGFLVKHYLGAAAAAPVIPPAPAANPMPSTGHPLLDLLQHALEQPGPIRDGLLALILPALAVSKDAVKVA